MRIHDINEIKLRISTLEAELRNDELIEYVLKMMDEYTVSFDLNSDLTQIERIPNTPGIYIFYIRFNFTNMAASWIQQFQDDWQHPDVKNFQHSPAIIASRLKKKGSSDEWVPLYLGKSEHTRHRVLSHINLEASKKTFALKLMARKHQMLKHDFIVKYYCFDSFKGMQILLRILEEEMRHKIEPITGRQ